MSKADRTDAESLLISGLLAEPERLIEARNVKPDMFSDERCRIVFKIIVEHNVRASAQGKILYATDDVVTRRVAALTNSKKKRTRDERRRFLAQIQAIEELVDEVREWPGISDHEFKDAVARVIEADRDDRARQGIIKIVDLYESRGVSGVYEGLNRLVCELHPSNTGRMDALLAEDAPSAWVEYQKTKASPEVARIPTMHPTLDKITGGGKLGRLWLVGAYAKDGKTQMAKEMLYAASVYSQRGCVAITSEQTKDDVRNMLVIRHSHRFIEGGLNFNRYVEGRLNPKEEAVLRKTTESLRDGDYGPITYWRAPGGTTIGEVRSYLDVVRRRHPVEVVMVDHTLLFNATRPQRSTVENLTVVLQELKALALEFNDRGLWVIAPHQIGRDGYDKALTRGIYLPSDLAGSAEAERSSDLVLWVLRTRELRECGEIKLGVAIDRWGPGAPDGWHAIESFASSAILPLEEQAT